MRNDRGDDHLRGADTEYLVPDHFEPIDAQLEPDSKKQKDDTEFRNVVNLFGA